MASSSSSCSSRRHLNFIFSKISAESGQNHCPICLSSIRERRLSFLSTCLHAYCLDCIRRWSTVKRSCPLCNSSFDSWLHRIDFRKRTFSRWKLAPVRDERKVGFDDRFRRPDRRRLFDGIRLREEARERNEFSRSRPLPIRRSFQGSADVVAERVLQWRASIYNQKLRAVPLDSPASSSRTFSQHQQSGLGKRSGLERTGRLDKWIRRELQAVLDDPDPTIIVHVVSSLYATSLEDGRGNGSDFLAPLRPFLHEWTDMFWHELRCFAESSLTIETYDTVVNYERIRE